MAIHVSLSAIHEQSRTLIKVLIVVKKRTRCWGSRHDVGYANETENYMPLALDLSI